MADAVNPSTVTLTIPGSPTTATLTLASPIPIGIVVLVTFLATIGGQTLIAILSWVIWRRRLLLRRTRAEPLDVEAKSLPLSPLKAPQRQADDPQRETNGILTQRSSLAHTPSLIGSSAMAVVGVDETDTPRSTSTYIQSPGESSLSARDRKDSRLAVLESAIEEAAKQANISDNTLARLIVAMQYTLLDPEEHDIEPTRESDPFVDPRLARRSTTSGSVSSEQPPSYKTTPIQKGHRRRAEAKNECII
ncbi:hypothetical protein EXIGLDRAFT_760511 [Exidia glandulosa HHB12029]|uniref:Uncharacterized protein n=1 Tax=Exidia glandulosa HHB12029 TaxID=1314781 RepID=A0A165PAX2_EXIGL|nr:hypothetical protein EXIGLDRAFT_760511 [Exidia glandulosa HHB12029]